MGIGDVGAEAARRPSQIYSYWEMMADDGVGVMLNRQWQWAVKHRRTSSAYVVSCCWHQTQDC